MAGDGVGVGDDFPLLRRKDCWLLVPGDMVMAGKRQGRNRRWSRCIHSQKTDWMNVFAKFNFPFLSSRAPRCGIMQPYSA